MKAQLPKYLIIKNNLINFILDGTLKKGTIIPSETNLMKQYGVSRITVRHAITELSNEGYIEKIQGKGCYVRDNKIIQPLSKIRSYTEEIDNLNMSVSRKVIKANVIIPEKYINDNLKIENNDSVFQISRIYYADNNPLCFTTAYLPYNYFNDIEKYNFQYLSLYDVIENNFMIKIERSKLEMEAVSSNNYVSELLNISPGTPLILFRSITFGIIKGEYIPIEYFETYYNTNKVHYTLEQHR